MRAGSTPGRANVRRAYAHVAGVGQLHYRFAGGAPPDAPPMLLLHQVSSNARMFDELLPALAADHRVIAPDLPGFGESDPLPEPPSIEAYGEAVHSLIAQLGLKGATVVGHHTGALVAVEIARRFPGSVARAILIGFPYYLTADDRAARLERIAPRRIAPQMEGRHLLDEWSRLRALDPVADPEVIHQELVDTLLAPRYDLGYQAAFRYDVARAVSEVTIPVAIVSGENDHLHPLQIRMSRDLGVALEVVPGGGVFMCRQLPDVVLAALERAVVRSATAR